MYDSFYITRKDLNGGDWYNLILVDTHFCVSCGGDLKKILGTLKTYVKRYRTKERLYSTMRDLESGGKVEPSVFEMRERLYNSEGHVYQDMIHGVIDEAYLEVRKYEKDNSPLKKVMNRMKKAGKVIPVEVAKEIVPVTKDLPKVMKKPKLIKV